MCRPCPRACVCAAPGGEGAGDPSHSGGGLISTWQRPARRCLSKRVHENSTVRTGKRRMWMRFAWMCKRAHDCDAHECDTERAWPAVTQASGSISRVQLLSGGAPWPCAAWSRRTTHQVSKAKGYKQALPCPIYLLLALNDLYAAATYGHWCMGFCIRYTDLLHFKACDYRVMSLRTSIKSAHLGNCYYQWYCRAKSVAGGHMDLR